MKERLSEPKKTGMTDPASVFIFLWMMIAVTLYIENRYFNVLQAKGHAFDAGCIAGLVLIAFFVIKDKSVHKLRPAADPTDWGFTILAAAAIISCLLSGDFKASFWGEQGWCVGGFAFLMAAILYMYLSKSFNMNQNFWLPVIAVNAFIFFIGILHSAGIDAFGIHTNIDPRQFYQYISTIGNVNMYVGYLCLIMPILACFFIESKGRTSQIIYLIAVVLGELNMILAGSDGLYMGIGVCAFFGIPYVFKDKRSAKRIFTLILIYGLELALVAVSSVFSEKKALIDGISGVFLKPAVFCAVIVLGIIGTAAFSLIDENTSKKLLKLMVVVCEAILVIVTLGMIIKIAGSFGPGWGSRRGAIWINSFEVFGKLGAANKLFGVGPEMLGKYFQKYSMGLTKRVLAAHSEPLQILMTTGFVGLSGWIMIWIGIIKRFFRKKLWTSPVMAFFLPLMAYLGQSLVNTPMATNWGILIVVISMFVYHSEREQY